jgi:hypothetical protein
MERKNQLDLDRQEHIL